MFIIIIISSSSITILLHSQLLNNTYIYSVLDKKTKLNINGQKQVFNLKCQ